MLVTYPIYIVTIDEKTGEAFVKQIEVPYNKSPEGYLNRQGIEYVDWRSDYEGGYDSMLETARLINGICTPNLLGKVMKCKQCGKYFYLSNSNISWYKLKNFTVPKRCMACRNANKEKKLVY